MNEVELVGRIANNLEMKTSSAGNQYIFITIATNKYAKGKQSTTFVPCVGFGKTAEFIANYFRKGQLVSALGEITVSEFTNADQVRTQSVKVKINSLNSLVKSSNKSEETIVYPNKDMLQMENSDTEISDEQFNEELFKNDVTNE